MAVAAVSRPVVVDEGSFLDSLFAPAGQDRRAMEHRPQDPGPRRRTIDWRLDERGALEARRSDIFSDPQVCHLEPDMWSRECSYLDDMRCVQHLILTSILPHF